MPEPFMPTRIGKDRADRARTASPAGPPTSQRVRERCITFAHVLQRRGRGWAGRLRGAGAATCRLALGLALCLGLGCAVDLRPAALPELPDAAARQAGAERLAGVARAQGLDRWQRFSELRFRLVDSSVASCFAGGLAAFWSASQTFDVQLAVRDSVVRVRFVAGSHGGETFGIKGDLAYRIAESGALEFERDSCTEQYLRSLRATLVLPLELAISSGSGDVSAFAAGERTLAGKSYDIVLVAAPAPYGTSADEQYVLWIERESARVEWLERTDRRRSRRAREVLHYLAYRDVQGVMLPERIERVAAVGDSAGRRLELSSLALD
jgi:hypothetical protein